MSKKERRAIVPTIYKDRVVDLMLREVRTELKAEKGIDIPEDVLLEVVNSQYAIIHDAFDMKEDVRIPYIGKFHRRKERIYKLAETRTKDYWGGKFYLTEILAANENDNREGISDNPTL